MPPNPSHAAISVYHAPATRPTTTELVTLQSGIDNLGVKLSRTPLVNCDTRNLQDAADDMERLLELVMSLSQRLGIEIASRRQATAPNFKVTAVGIMLFDPRSVLTPEQRVRIAEDEARAEREEVALAYDFTPGKDETPHPVAVGSCDLAVLAGSWDCDDRRGA